MNTPHKYAKEIMHWANGGEIQVLNTSQTDPVWLDMEGDKLPKFNSKHLKWRIKSKVLQYRVALMQMRDKSYFTTTQSSNSEESVDIELDMEDGFVRWLPDDKWIEVEV